MSKRKSKKKNLNGNASCSSFECSMSSPPSSSGLVSTPKDNCPKTYENFEAFFNSDSCLTLGEPPSPPKDLMCTRSYDNLGHCSSCTTLRAFQFKDTSKKENLLDGGDCRLGGGRIMTARRDADEASLKKEVKSKKSQATIDEFSSTSEICEEDDVDDESCDESTSDVCDDTSDICHKSSELCDESTSEVCYKPPDICDKPPNICDKPPNICDKPPDVCDKSSDVCDDSSDVCDDSTSDICHESSSCCCDEVPRIPTPPCTPFKICVPPPKKCPRRCRRKKRRVCPCIFLNCEPYKPRVKKPKISDDILINALLKKFTEKPTVNKKPTADICTRSYDVLEACFNGGSCVTLRIFKDSSENKYVHDGSKKIAAAAKPMKGGMVNITTRVQSSCSNIRLTKSDTSHIKCPTSTKMKNNCRSMSNLDEYFKPEPDTSKCCVQESLLELKRMISGENIVEPKKKQSKVCLQRCIDPESDVVLMQLRTKKSCDRKQEAVDIELKTPKIPIPRKLEYCARTSQVKGPKIDRAVARCKPKPDQGILWPSKIPFKRYKSFLRTKILYK